jgi:hypothetical protein
MIRLPVPMPIALASCIRMPWWNEPSSKPGRTTPRPPDDRRPGPAPAASLTGGGQGESPVRCPTLDEQNNSGRGCNGRAGSCSRPPRRCRRCQSCAPVARSPDCGAYRSAAPSWLEHLPARPSQTWLEWLLAAIPFLPVETTSARTAIPVPCGPGADQGHDLGRCRESTVSATPTTPPLRAAQWASRTHVRNQRRTTTAVRWL